jgi:hypothetical protein
MRTSDSHGILFSSVWTFPGAEGDQRAVVEPRQLQRGIAGPGIDSMQLD